MLSKLEKKILQYFEENYDINDNLTFLDYEEKHTIEIENDEIMMEIELTSYAQPHREIGGEPDEILTVMRNKSIALNQIRIWDRNNDRVSIGDQFLSKLENLLNSQIDED